MITKQNISKNLSIYIKQQRALCDITQQALAEKAHLSYKQVQRLETPTKIEKGRGLDPQLSTLVKLSIGLDVKLTELIKAVTMEPD